MGSEQGRQAVGMQKEPQDPALHINQILLKKKEEKSLQPLTAFYEDGGGYSVTRVLTKALLFLIGPEMLRPNV